jgi:hypothetical protein
MRVACVPRYVTAAFDEPDEWATPAHLQQTGRHAAAIVAALTTPRKTVASPDRFRPQHGLQYISGSPDAQKSLARRISHDETLERAATPHFLVPWPTAP